jgi:protein-tyrosine phosphatase
MPPAHTIEQFVDIHCHMLPGLDDGAADWNTALMMAEMAARDGIGIVVTTPHQLGNFSQNLGDTIRQQVLQFQALLNRHAIPLRVLPGADVRIEPEMIAKIRRGEVLTLADRGRYVLLELPHEVYLPLDRLLQELEHAGLIGILSHPERNLGILRQPQLVETLVQAGCLMQVTAGSLVGTFGPQSQALAEQWVRRGFVHFLATDAHSAHSRRPLLRRAFQRVGELAGPEAARELCARNPARIVANQSVARGRLRVKRMPSFARWFTSRRAG